MELQAIDLVEEIAAYSCLHVSARHIWSLTRDRCMTFNRTSSGRSGRVAKLGMDGEQGIDGFGIGMVDPEHQYTDNVI